MDLILGAPRRRWARGEKLAAVAATFSPGVTVTEVARNLGIRTSMLYTWRKTLRAEAGFPEASRVPTFVPVTVNPDPVLPASASPTAVTPLGTIEISFTHAPQMRISGSVDPALATAVVAALSGR